MASSNKNRILVVDDEEFCLGAMKALLQKSGVDVANRVDYCINGLESVKTINDARQYGISYRVIFTDFSMPHLDGIESTRKIREFYRRMGVAREDQPQIIGVTGHTLKEFSDKGFEAGMNRIESKPFYLKTMQSLINELFVQRAPGSV